jgi:predicted transcriptional regulator
MGTNRVDFRLPDDLVEKADVVADLTHRNRTEVVKEALRSYFDDVEDDDRFRETVVEYYLDDAIDFETLVAFVGRRDAEAIRASKGLLESGEEIARDLADAADE